MFILQKKKGGGVFQHTVSNISSLLGYGNDPDYIGSVKDKTNYGEMSVFQFFITNTVWDGVNDAFWGYFNRNTMRRREIRTFLTKASPHNVNPCEFRETLHMDS